MEDWDNLDYDFYEFKAQMEQATALLKKMNNASRAMHWQFGEPDYYENFVREMNEAQGWMSSHC